MEEEAMKRRMREQIDAQMLAGVGFTSTVSSAPQEPLTLDTLRRMMLQMPPRETWLSSRLFPSDSAFCVKGAGENFTCAHPGFWLRIEHEMRRVAKPTEGPVIGLGMDLRPIEIDPWRGHGEEGDADYIAPDTPETAAWRAAHWDRLREAVEVAMTPLPEWLRAPPKFSEHG